MTWANFLLSARLGTGIYNHQMGILNSISLMALLPVVLLAFWVGGRSRVEG